jgi:hypothetical protein
LLIVYQPITGEDFVLGMDRGNKEEVEVNEIADSKNQKRKTKAKGERTRRGTTITLTLEGCIFFPILRTNIHICIDLSRRGVAFLAYKHKSK